MQKKNEQMKELMVLEGLPYKNRSHTYNSRLAQEIGVWAEAQTGTDTIHEKFFQAYFVEGRNIGKIEVIIDLVKSIGLDVEGARMVIKRRQCKGAIDSHWDKSYRYGITGVPTYICNGQKLVGAQPYGNLKILLDEVGVEKMLG